MHLSVSSWCGSPFVGETGIGVEEITLTIHRGCAENERRERQCSAAPRQVSQSLFAAPRMAFFTSLSVSGHNTPRKTLCIVQYLAIWHKCAAKRVAKCKRLKFAQNHCCAWIVFCNNRADGKPRTAAIVGHVDAGGDLAALNPVRTAGDVPSLDQVRALGRRLDICPYPPTTSHPL